MFILLWLKKELFRSSSAFCVKLAAVFIFVMYHIQMLPLSSREHSSKGFMLPLKHVCIIWS